MTFKKKHKTDVTLGNMWWTDWTLTNAKKYNHYLNTNIRIEQRLYPAQHTQNSLVGFIQMNIKGGHGQIYIQNTHQRKKCISLKDNFPYVDYIWD